MFKFDQFAIIICMQVKDNLDFTPLHKAAIRGHKQAVKSLLTATGKSTDLLKAKNANGSTALILACSGGHKEVRYFYDYLWLSH